MSKISAFALLLICLFVGACGTTGKVLETSLCAFSWGCGGAEKIEDPSKRIENACVSVLPPQGQGWSIVRKRGWWISDTIACTPIVFGKGDRSTSETYIAYVAPFEIPEIETDQGFLDRMKENYADMYEIERYEVIYLKEEILVGRADICSTHSYLVEDTGMPEEYRKSEFMYLEDVHVNCRHPYHEHRAIRVSYSHRYNPGNKDQEFNDDALEFFGNVKFLE